MNKKFVLISDTHGDHHKVVLPHGDVLIHAGDCTGDSSLASAMDFIQWFSSQPFKQKIFIAGNHDKIFESNPDFISNLIKDLAPNCHYLQDSGIEIDSVKFWGSPVQPEFFNWAFNRKRGNEIKKHWDLIPVDTDVLITHGPPYEILDLSNNWDHSRGRKHTDHLGCEELMKKIMEVKPKLHVFGHIHGSGGKVVGLPKEHFGKDMHFANASLMDENYSLTHKPIVITL